MDGEQKESAHSMTKQDMMALGLYGGTNASERRAALMKKLHLPERMSANALLQALNLLYSREQLEQLVQTMEKENG